MLPKAVLAALGVTEADLLAAMPFAAEYRSMFEFAAKKGPRQQIYNRFAKEWAKYAPKTAPSIISQAYKLGRAFAEPYRWFGEFGEGIAPPDWMARLLHGSQSFAADYGGFMTRLKVTVTDPITGDVKTYGFWVPSYQPLSMLDLRDEAQPQLEEIIGRSPTVGGRRILDGLVVTYEVTDFGQF